MDISKVLIERGYKEKTAIIVAENLLAIDDCLVDILNNWIKYETETDFIAEGFSLLSIKEKFDMTYPAALLTMDWLLKEPSIAKKAIQRGIK